MCNDFKVKNNKYKKFIILLSVLPSCIILYLIIAIIRIFIVTHDFNIKIRLIVPLLMAIIVTLIVFLLPVFILKRFAQKRDEIK